MKSVEFFYSVTNHYICTSKCMVVAIRKPETLWWLNTLIRHYTPNQYTVVKLINTSKPDMT